MKWLQERNDHGDNLEAKLKSESTRYSIKFSRDGFFEDLEKEVSFSYIEKAAASKIKQKLSNYFDRFKIKRTQHHYSWDQEEVIKLYKTGKAWLSYVVQRYEIVVYGIKDQKIHSYENIFSIEGDFGERLKNAEDNTDNLLFWIDFSSSL